MTGAGWTTHFSPSSPGSSRTGRHRCWYSHQASPDWSLPGRCYEQPRRAVIGETCVSAAHCSSFDCDRAMNRPIDPHAVRIPERSGLPVCLYLPLAARNVEAIENYVGTIDRALAPRSKDRAFLVTVAEPSRGLPTLLRVNEVLRNTRDVLTSQ